MSSVDILYRFHVITAIYKCRTGENKHVQKFLTITSLLDEFTQHNKLPRYQTEDLVNLPLLKEIRECWWIVYRWDKMSERSAGRWRDRPTVGGGCIYPFARLANVHQTVKSTLHVSAPYIHMYIGDRVQGVIQHTRTHAVGYAKPTSQISCRQFRPACMVRSSVGWTRMVSLISVLACWSISRTLSQWYRQPTLNCSFKLYGVCLHITVAIVLFSSFLFTVLSISRLTNKADYNIIIDTIFITLLPTVVMLLMYRIVFSFALSLRHPGV